MYFKGSVRGVAARKYAGFTYRKPIMASIDMWQLDPERLNYADEHPRSVNPPSQPNTEAVELADYAVMIGERGADGTSKVQVFVLPSDYTVATEQLLVCEFFVSNAFELRHEYVDEALRRAFG